MSITNNFVVRERKREIARLHKRKSDVQKRIADMNAAVELIEKQIDEHETEIKNLEDA